MKKLIALLPAVALVLASLWGCSPDATKKEVNPCAKASSLSLEIGSDAAKAQFVVVRVQTSPRPKTNNGGSSVKPKSTTGPGAGNTTSPSDTGKQTTKPATTKPSPKAENTAQAKKFKPTGTIKSKKKVKSFEHAGRTYADLYLHITDDETEYYILPNGNVVFIEYKDQDLLPDGVEYNPSSDGDVDDFMSAYMPAYIPGDPIPTEAAVDPLATNSPVC